MKRVAFPCMYFLYSCSSCIGENQSTLTIRLSLWSLNTNILRLLTVICVQFQIHIAVNLHHWKTAMDLLKDEEERNKQMEMNQAT